MLYINEWLPNPKGVDTAGEFIELYNGGKAPVSLSGWSFGTGNGKKIPLPGRMVGAGGYLLLKRGDAKFALKNSDGQLFLYGPGGAMRDTAAFVGAAPEGKSFSRIDYGAEATVHFAFTDPTPGTSNKTISNQIAEQHYPVGVPLNNDTSAVQVAGMMAAVAFILAALFIYVIQTSEHLQKLFFGRDEEAWL